MRVLITGHEGYIGSVLVPVLREAGHDVTGIDTGMFAACVLGPAPAGVPTLRLDLRDVRPEHCRGPRQRHGGPVGAAPGRGRRGAGDVSGGRSPAP